MNKKEKVFYKKLRENLNKESWRYGQTVFNTMYTLHPEVAQKYCGMRIDPFHNDDNVDQFIEKCFNELYEEDNENQS